MEEIEKNALLHLHDYQDGVIRTYRDEPVYAEKTDSYILLKKGDNWNMQLCLTEDAPIKSGKRDYPICVPNSEERLETVYCLKDVFNRETYATSKKYHDKVTRWLHYFDNNNYRIEMLNSEEYRRDVNALYKEWYEAKELDEDMIRRYQNCIDHAFTDSDIFILGMFNKDNKLVGFRTYYKNGKWGFDLSNSVTRNEYNYLSEVFQVNSLKWLMDNTGVEYYNLGLSDGSLRLHKKLLPSFDISYYVIREGE